jgi:lipopolysaccharide/colanic/teichoic acid biosynthesis glycosyltransferase
VEAVSGAIMMVPRPVLYEVGYLDEAFFMYGEDLDWCYRIRENGWKVRYFSGTQIIHFKGESSKRAQFDRLKVFYQAMTKFAHKHFRAKYLFMPYWLLWLAIWARAGFAFLRNSLNYLGAPLTDFVLLSLSLLVSVRLRFGDLADLGRFVPVFLAYCFIWMFLLNYFGCYHKNKFSSSKATLAILLGFFINAAVTFFFKQYAFSRAVVLIAGMLSLIVVPGWRLLVRILPRLGLMPFRGTLGKTLLARNALIVGDLKSGEKLLKKFNSQIDSGYNVAGLITINGKSIEEVSDGVPVLGSLSDLSTVINECKIQEVIFSTHQLSYDRILGIMSQSGKQRVNFKLVPSTFEVIIGKASIDRIDDLPLLELDYRLHQPHNQILKRGFDIAVTVLLAVMAVPVFLFKKYLTGTKLREKIVIGNFNRKFTLYEFANGHWSIINKIPYLWSVLKGDVSFVGSELVEATSETVGKNRIELKPGITGLAQVNRHKSLTLEDKEKYYLYYLKNYSPLLDLEILLKAIFKI